MQFPPGLVWSPSALSRFETCARMYGEESWFKSIPFVETMPMKQGKLTHKQLEDYVSFGTDLPTGLNHVKLIVDTVTAGAEFVVAERKGALSYDMKTCGYYDDPNLSMRCVIDLTALRGNAAFALDYKTGGTPHESFDQLKANALFIFVERPMIETVHAFYVYTKHKLRRISIARSEMEGIVNEFYPRLVRLKEAIDTGVFPPEPNRLCGWCQVKTCEFNTNRGRKV